MPAPFLSYLRVYEPLRAFDGASGARVRAALARGPLTPERAAGHERELCLRAQLAARLLPRRSVDGCEVLVLGGASGEPLVCPLDTRERAAAAVLAFLESEAPVLRASALPVPEAVARRQAEAAVAELGQGAAHVVSASWTVPLPWFALVDPEERQLRLDGRRRVWWRVPMGRARARAAQAERIVRGGLGDGEPADVLAETGAWLAQFDRASVVELDYGGVVDLVDDEALRNDDSADQVRDALQALREGDTAAAQASYDRLREFWADVAGKQRTC
ncbi:MAG TPA: hypothetical protein VLK57_08545 [Pseudonocardia sp.]|jgi:hypothetical protein|nr:hypothetical protein [Pseudonocardia sp.]